MTQISIKKITWYYCSNSVSVFEVLNRLPMLRLGFSNGWAIELLISPCSPTIMTIISSVLHRISLMVIYLETSCLNLAVNQSKGVAQHKGIKVMLNKWAGPKGMFMKQVAFQPTKVDPDVISERISK